METWCDQRQLSPGAIITLRQCWELARHWYPGRDRLEWVPRSREEAQEIFRTTGLTGRFWDVD